MKNIPWGRSPDVWTVSSVFITAVLYTIHGPSLYNLHCTGHPIWYDVCVRVLPWPSCIVYVLCLVIDRAMTGSWSSLFIKASCIPQRSRWPNYTCIGAILALETKLKAWISFSKSLDDQSFWLARVVRLYATGDFSSHEKWCTIMS
jgi:hypothetical protein